MEKVRAKAFTQIFIFEQKRIKENRKKIIEKFRFKWNKKCFIKIEYLREKTTKNAIKKNQVNQN